MSSIVVQLNGLRIVSPRLTEFHVWFYSMLDVAEKINSVDFASKTSVVEAALWLVRVAARSRSSVNIGAQSRDTKKKH